MKDSKDSLLVKGLVEDLETWVSQYITSKFDEESEVSYEVGEYWGSKMTAVIENQ